MDKVKYTRTYHVHWSNGVQSDDKILSSLDHFEGKEIVVTEKLDGENTSLYSAQDGGALHARSLDSQFNWTRSWITKMHSVLQHDIPAGMKLTGENMFAEHSVRYNDLESYFYLFSIWEKSDNGIISLSWDDVVEWAKLFDLALPQVFYRGVFDEKLLIQLAKNLDPDKVEGYVIRSADSFLVSETNKNIAKYVRPNHVQDNSEHWLKNAKQNGNLINPVKPFYMK